MKGSLYLLDTNILLALVRGQRLGRYIDGHFGLRHGRQRRQPTSARAHAKRSRAISLAWTAMRRLR
jgi:hypothetical protein